MNPRPREATPFPTQIPAPPTADVQRDPAPGTVAACLARLARAAAAAAGLDEVHAALTAALYEALGVDQVLLVEVAQGAGAGDAHVMRHEGGEDPGYVQVLNDGRPSGTARVVATDAPLHVVDAAGSDELRQDLVERFDAASALFVPVSWGGEVRHVAISIFHERRELSDDEPAARPRAAPTPPRPGSPGSRPRRAPGRAPARTRRWCAPRAR